MKTKPVVSDNMRDYTTHLCDDYNKQTMKYKDPDIKQPSTYFNGKLSGPFIYIYIFFFFSL